MKKRCSLFWRTWVFAGLIFLGSSVPGDPIDAVVRWNSLLERIVSDRLLHFIAYAGFAVVLSLDCMAARPDRFPWEKILAFVLGFGFLLELWQALLPYRAFELHDLVFDLMGGGLGILLFLMGRRMRKDSA